MKIDLVISLFDGIACGLTALKRAGIEVGEYHAFEIDKHAIKIAKKNHPEIIHHGSVVDFDFKQFKGADLLIGGSPCQDLSVAGKQKGLIKGERSKLFFEYVRAKEEIQPKNFLLENVAMKKEYEAAISKLMGCYPVLINSALVSAQNRNRLYWCNWKVRQPKDKGINANNICDNGYAAQIKDNGFNKKQVMLTNKFPCLTAVYNSICGYGRPCVAFNVNINKKLLYTIKSHVRKINVNEAERLQTVDDNYTESASNTQRYKMLGNGWTVDVVAHIFKELYFPKENQENCNPIYQRELF